MFEMIAFIKIAPYFMLGAFFLTFTITRLAQSQTLYNLFSDAFSENREKKVKRIIKEMEIVRQCLVGDEKEESLSPEKQKLLNQVRQGYYRELGSLYKKGNNDGRTK